VVNLYSLDSVASFCSTRFSLPAELHTVGAATVDLHMTIQPWAKSPVVAQVAPSEERHSVIAALRLTASLRAYCTLATKSLVYEASLLLSIADSKDGTTSRSSTAIRATVTSSSIRVKPRSRRRVLRISSSPGTSTAGSWRG
jgi:hypothetical protein